MFDSTPTSRLRRAAAAVLASAAFACAGPSSTLSVEGEPYVRGPIESITHHATATGLLVRAGPGSREACGIAATADAETRYLRRSPAGDLGVAALAELEVGDTVEVYVEGPVAESCPVQGRASALVVVTGGA